MFIQHDITAAAYPIPAKATPSLGLENHFRLPLNMGAILNTPKPPIVII